MKMELASRATKFRLQNMDTFWLLKETIIDNNLWLTLSIRKIVVSAQSSNIGEIQLNVILFPSNYFLIQIQVYVKICSLDSKLKFLRQGGWTKSIINHHITTVQWKVSANEYQTIIFIHCITQLIDYTQFFRSVLPTQCLEGR